MTVVDNLMAGSYLLKDKRQIEENLKRVYELFPVCRADQSKYPEPCPAGSNRCWP